MWFIIIIFLQTVTEKFLEAIEQSWKIYCKVSYKFEDIQAENLLVFY